MVGGVVWGDVLRKTLGCCTSHPVEFSREAAGVALTVTVPVQCVFESQQFCQSAVVVLWLWVVSCIELGCYFHSSVHYLLNLIVHIVTSVVGCYTSHPVVLLEVIAFKPVDCGHNCSQQYHSEQVAAISANHPQHESENLHLVTSQCFM